MQGVVEETAGMGAAVFFSDSDTGGRHFLPDGNDFFQITVDVPGFEAVDVVQGEFTPQHVRGRATDFVGMGEI